MRGFALSLYFSQWAPRVRHHLSASNCETPTLSQLIALASDDDRDRWENLALGYSDPRGSDALRAAIADGYAQADARAIVCFCGAQEAIYAAMRALLGDGDHVIVITPNYQSTETIPLGLCAVTGIALDPDDCWSLDIDEVAAAIRPNTKMISVNFPNNPTGKILERDRFDALVALCRRHGVWLFSDEVYRLIERNPEARLPAAVDVYERGISVGTMSKSYGLPGLRIGWIACRDRGLLDQLERVKHYLSSCNAAPCELLAEIALKAGDEILGRNRRIATDNIGRLSDFFGAYADLFDWYVPDGGVIGYPRYKGAEGVERLCARLIEEEGVLLLPASVYRSDLLVTSDDRFRIGFGHSNVAGGLNAMKANLDRAAVADRGAQ
jgi:aspartate/methionine/tyrosine aminotransferase